MPACRLGSQPHVHVHVPARQSHHCPVWLRWGTGPIHIDDARTGRHWRVGARCLHHHLVARPAIWLYVFDGADDTGGAGRPEGAAGLLDRCVELRAAGSERAPHSRPPSAPAPVLSPRTAQAPTPAPALSPLSQGTSHSQCVHPRPPTYLGMSGAAGNLVKFVGPLALAQVYGEENRAVLVLGLCGTISLLAALAYLPLPRLIPPPTTKVTALLPMEVYEAMRTRRRRHGTRTYGRRHAGHPRLPSSQAVTTPPPPPPAPNPSPRNAVGVGRHASMRCVSRVVPRARDHALLRSAAYRVTHSACACPGAAARLVPSSRLAGMSCGTHDASSGPRLTW